MQERPLVTAVHSCTAAELEKPPAWGRENSIMPDSGFSQDVARPAKCPFCKSKIIDTLAKVITATAVWRCRECDQTWTIASLKGRSTGIR